MKKRFKLAVAMALAVSAGCATQVKLTEKEVANRFPELATLSQSLGQAEENQVSLLSSSLYAQAKKGFDDANQWAAGGSDKARVFAANASTALQQAVQSTAVAKDELAMVLLARERAITSGADKKYADKFVSAEKQLREFGDLIAKGKLADVREDRQSLAQRYASLELDSLKSTTASEAAGVIAKAVSADADDYSPVMLKKAQEELTLARKVLETDRTATDKAANHAQMASWYANRALQVTEVIKEFKQSEMTDEQIVLWYQDQVSRAVSPVIGQVDFSMTNKAVINNIAASLSSLKGKSLDLASQMTAQQSSSSSLLANKEAAYEKTLAETEARYRAILERKEAEYLASLASKDQALAKLQSETAAERQQEEQIKQKFASVQGLFDAQEAEVYRQGNNVLIRAYGFSFASGKSEIQSSNFPLMNKIIQAVKLFPASSVEVSGHTDNRGSDSLNMKLSDERAQKVGRFLVDVGNIEDKRVSGKGYGKTRPLASNETDDGRAANRRVEILIVNG